MCTFCTLLSYVAIPFNLFSSCLPCRVPPWCVSAVSDDWYQFDQLCMARAQDIQRGCKHCLQNPSVAACHDMDWVSPCNKEDVQVYAQACFSRSGTRWVLHLERGHQQRVSVLQKGQWLEGLGITGRELEIDTCPAMHNAIIEVF